MTPPSSTPQRIRFNGFEVDLHTGELLRSGRKLRLPNQSFHVLAMLLGKAGQLVTREELRARLWPNGTFVEYDQSLNAAVNRLREALHDSAEKPRFIETLPKRGYRFIGHVEMASASEPAPAKTDAVAPVAALERPGAPESPSSGPAVGAASLDTPRPMVPELIAPGSVGTPRMGLVLLAVIAAIVLIAGGIYLLGHGSASVADLPPHREVVPFTSFPGQELAPTFSPDGSHIAFAWNGETGDDRLFDLYVKEIGSERLLRITRSPAKTIVPVWSPDGGAIAFVRWTDTSAAIFVIPALGGPERLVVSKQVAVGHLIRISWSPDGKWIAYPAYAPSGAQRVYRVSLDTLQSEPLRPTPECLDVLEPAFSPDGTQLAVVCTASWSVYTIYTVGLADGSLRRLASMMGDPQGLAWVANGSRLIFSNDTGRGGELWELTLAGQLSQLPFGEDGTAPAVATRGAHIAYVRGRNITDIWRVDLTAEHPEQSATKLIYSTRGQRNPRYANDGAHIAFQSNRSGSTEIWLADGSGADPLRLTSFNGPFTDMPSWCSDGRRIAFDSSASGAPAIYVEDINERLPRKLWTSRTNLTRPGWSQDCRWLFAGDDGFPHRVGLGNSDKPTLYKIPVAGGPAEPVTHQPAYYPIGLPDRILFGVMEPTGVSLWYKPAGDGAEKRLEEMPKLSYSDAWTANAKGVFYADTSAQPISVNFYDFTTHAIRRVATFKNGPVPGGGFGIAVTADGHWLLYTQVDDPQSDIMLGPSS
jgi:Tol biopolymer transport system component/DNA-binding winged helix-turn-helix (wHTH) protein